MWIIPIILIGAIVVAAASKSPRETASPSRQLPPPPGPISVLGEILRIGQAPPPKVILCAIAEAEAIGRSDIVSDIVRAFVAPVVYQHQAMNDGASLPYERGSCALPLPGSPRARSDHQRGSCALPPAPRAEAAHVPPPPPSLPSSLPSSSLSSLPAAQPTPRPATEEQIVAMLHADPKAFLSMVAAQQPRRGPAVEVFPPGTRPPTADSPPPVPVSPAAVAPSTVVPLPVTQPIGLPPETVAQMQDAAGLPEAADRTRSLAPGSPLGGVADGAWREFVVRLEREAPTFSSSRHVGQYRQRRERLAELGIDPNAIHGSASAQRAALDADLVDAHGHAAAGGLISEHLGRAITLPGHDGAETITLSGLLGVIQCAGLEGAVGWLERSSDRKRYPHTTQAFQRTNNLF